MSTVLSAEISATCNALGYFDEKTNKYYTDSNTLETVKDLIRYLRRDDERHSIRRQLGQTNILKSDLLPMLKSYHQEEALFDVLLRLIMNLTTPPFLLFDFKIPTDLILRNIYLEMEDHLKSFKEAFVDEGVWAVFSAALSKILEIDYSERGEENGVKMERILILIRNILFVPSDIMEKRPDNDANVHDQVLWALHHSGLLDIILYITTNPLEQSYYMHVLEIIFFMLREQQPHELVNAALERSQSEKIRDEAELINIRNVENVRKQLKTKKYAGTRHSRFGGTFVVQSMKSISDNALISHKPLNDIDSLSFDGGKSRKKTPKNRAPLKSNMVERRSAFTIRLFLKEFCVEFLNGAYNTLMRYIKGILVRSGDEAHDESYYFWAIHFFMAFNRSYKFEVKLVSETLSLETFHYIQKQSEDYFDRLKSDRKSVLIWSRRLHTALLSYKELLSTLLKMDKSTDYLVRESSKVIKNNLFYVPEYREFILTLLLSYDEIKMSNLYLLELMETQHLFVKMFETICQSDDILVQKKSKSRKKKKVDNKCTESEINEQLNTLWDKTSHQLSAVLEASGDFLTNEVPFDAASDIPIDDQKGNCMKNIQKKLRASEFESAIGLMRAAREVWPESNCFGSDNMTTEEEFLALREIFYINLGDAPQKPEESDEDNDEEVPRQQPQEVKFNFNEFVGRLAHPRVVRACGIALRTFDTNSVNANHSIIKLLHRIAFDCKMYVMLFQLSMFRTFQKVFQMKDVPQYKELVKFCIFIVRQFVAIAEKNDKVYIEALFWKTKKEAYEIEHGYGTSQAKSVSKVWTEDEEAELQELFKEFTDNNIQEDLIDWILKNLIDNKNKSRRMVLKKLREIGLVDNYKEIKKSKKSSVWNESEEVKLGELYQEYKDAADPIGLILNTLNNRSRKNIVDKLLELNLISDRKEVRKKRTNKSHQSRNDSDLNSDSESDSDHVTSTNTKTKTKERSYNINTNTKEVTQIIKTVLKAGMREGLEWLKDSIGDAIEDFDDSNESIPLVTLSENVEMCMENSDFQSLLRAFGITEPFDEQESYWRIPEGIQLDTLKHQFDMLTSGLNGNESEDDEENNTVDNEIVERIDEERSLDDKEESINNDFVINEESSLDGKENTVNSKNADESNEEVNDFIDESSLDNKEESIHNEKVRKNLVNRFDDESSLQSKEDSVGENNILNDFVDVHEDSSSSSKRSRDSSDADSPQLKRARLDDDDAVD